MNHTLLLFPIFAQIVLTEMYYDGFHRSFCDDDDDLEIIQESDSIFAFETPELFRPEQIRSKRGGTTSCQFFRDELCLQAAATHTGQDIRQITEV